MSDSPDQDFLEAEVESTMAPLRAMGLSPAVLLETENLLRVALTAHPAGCYLMRRARPRMEKESGSVPIDDAQDIPAKVGSAR
jgi:hypothetical protein